MPYETQKNSQNEQERSVCICLDKINYLEGYKINKPVSGLLIYRRVMPSAER